MNTNTFIRKLRAFKGKFTLKTSEYSTEGKIRSKRKFTRVDSTILDNGTHIFTDKYPDNICPIEYLDKITNKRRKARFYDDAALALGIDSYVRHNIILAADNHADHIRPLRKRMLAALGLKD